MSEPNCIDVRRALLSEPGADSPELRAHALTCASCQAFVREVRAEEDLLREALNVEVPEGLGARVRLRQTMSDARDDAFDNALRDAARVPVPDGLAARIMQRNALGLARSRKRGRLTQFALAASVALAVATGSILFLARSPDTASNDALLNAVVTHSAHHAGARTEPIGDELLRPALRLVGLEFGQRPQGVITAATACYVREQLSLHLVMRGDHGPVNVYVMPGQRSKRTVEASERAWRGLVMPVRHGSLAVVGHSREQLDKYATSVRDALRWRM